jgi:tripartite-type tricarboxylate transporter receptor subunit TctC
MHYRIPNKRFAVAMATALSAAIMMPVPLLAQNPPIKFTTFNVPGSAGGSCL